MSMLEICLWGFRYLISTGWCGCDCDCCPADEFNIDVAAMNLALPWKDP